MHDWKEDAGLEEESIVRGQGGKALEEGQEGEEARWRLGHGILGAPRRSVRNQLAATYAVTVSEWHLTWDVGDCVRTGEDWVPAGAWWFMGQEQLALWPISWGLRVNRSLGNGPGGTSRVGIRCPGELELEGSERSRGSEAGGKEEVKKKVERDEETIS